VLSDILYRLRLDGEEDTTNMAVSMKQMSLVVSALGVLSFVLGVIAENKKVQKKVVSF